MNRKISIFFFIVLIIGLVSCSKDFLDKEPLTDRVEDNFYRTPNDAFQAVVAIYDVLQWQSSGGYHPYDLVSNILSDDAFAGGSGPGDRPGLVRMAKFSSYTNDEEPSGLWRDRYTGIYRANILLEKIDNITFPVPALKDRYIAEARFLRGYYYFQLVQLFGNIPLILKTLTPAEYQSQVQANPADVYNQVAADLWFAYQTLPASIPDVEKGRISKWAAGAMLARVYLYHKGYGKGVLGISSDLKAGDKTFTETDIETIIDDIVNSSGHDLVVDYANLWGAQNKNTIESVFEIQHTSKSDWGDWGWRNGTEGNWTIIMSGFRGVTDATYDAGWSFQPATMSLVNEFQSYNDPRYEPAILAGTELTSYSPTACYQHTGYAFQKVQPVLAFKPTTNDMLNWPNNWMVVRFADVLLMGAELNLDNDLGKAQQYFDRVYQRAWGINSTPPSLNGGETGLEIIYHERRLEFAGEGLRYWDLLRRGLDYAKAKIDAASDVDPSNELFNPATKGLLPIPSTEITLSGNKLVQNAGY